MGSTTVVAFDGEPLFLMGGARRPLLSLLAAATIPVILFAAWIAYRAADQQRNAALASAVNAVNRVAERVTAEVSAQVRIAQTLALSETLDGPDLTAFYAEARRVRDANPLWHTIELDDLSGVQILNLLRPLDKPLGPTADSRSFDRVVQTHAPDVAGIGPIGPVSGERLVSVRVPVMRDQKIRFVITVAFAPNAVSEILGNAGIPDGWIGAVVDRAGMIIARNIDNEIRSGHPAGAALQSAIRSSSSGFYEAKTFDDVDVQTVFRTVAGTGNWSVHLGIPSDALDGPVRRSMYAVAGGVAVSLFLAGGLAIALSDDFVRQRRNEQRHAREALAASEERGALAIEAAQLGTWRWNTQSDEIVGSLRCQAMLGLPDHGAARLTWTSAMFLEAIHIEDRALIRDIVQRSRNEDQPFEIEFRALGVSGNPRWLRARGRAGSKAEISCVVTDIGPQKRAETERLTLLRRLNDAQEDVKRRLARELHDQVGQTVTGLALGLKGLERSLAAFEHGDGVQFSQARTEALDQVNWLRSLTADITHDLHRVAVDLRPTALDDLGLGRALTAHVRDWSSRYGIVAELQFLGMTRLSASIETAVYRVVQEALTNILRHAKAGQVSLIFEQHASELKIVIEDDGVGMKPDTLNGRTAKNAGAHLGLSGMHERLSLIGGRLTIESSEDHGTTLFVQVPTDSSQIRGPLE